jgi:hypothetical protein
MPHPHNARTAEGFHKASLLAKKMLPSGRLSQRSKVSRLQLSEFHQRSSRMPLKNGCRTLPSADLARIRSQRAATARPRFPGARSSWRRLRRPDQRLEPRLQVLGRCAVKAVVKPCRHRSDLCPCVCRGRCRSIFCHRARSRRRPVSHAGHRSFSPNR